MTEERGSKVVGLLSLLLFLWLGLCQAHLTRLRRTARRLTTGSAVSLLNTLTNNPPKLLTHDAVQSPFLAGIVRPVIFLPATSESEFDSDALRAIFAHELAHRDRRDNLWTLAARLLTALLWYQPLLWLLCKRLEQISEDACDEAVLASNCPSRAYAACLLSLATRPPLPRRQQTLTAGVAPFRSSLGRRIARILAIKGSPNMPAVTLRLRLTIAVLTLAAVTGGAFLVSSAPAASPQSTDSAVTPELMRFHAAGRRDRSNLHEIGLAIIQYEEDHNERMPDAHRWMDQIAPYRRDPNIFFDPFQPGKHRYAYAFNVNCSQKPLSAFAAPAETVLLFDSKLGTRNAADTGQSLQVHSFLQGGLVTPGSDYCYVDGHSKFHQSTVHPSFSLEGGDPVTTEAAADRAVALRQITRDLTHYLKPEQGKLNQSQLLSGETSVAGPGAVVTLRDSQKKLPASMPKGFAPANIIHDSDINAIVNELRAAGAEAIAVNGQRLVATSAVRSFGPTIYINGVPQAAPFVIKAIGNPQTLSQAMNLPGGVASQIKAYDPAMFSVQAAPTLVLPAYTGGSQPRYAKPVDAPTSDALPQESGAYAYDFEGVHTLRKKVEASASTNALPKRSFLVNYSVPARGTHNVQVYVTDAEGRHLVSAKTYELGAKVYLAVTAAGRPVSFQLYDNGRLVKTQQIADAPASGSATSPAQQGLVSFRDKTQEKLAADQATLDQYEQAFQAELRGALPDADAPALKKASNLESGLGGLVMSRQSIEESVQQYTQAGKRYASAAIAKKYAQANQRHLALIAVRQSEIKPLLTQEAHLFPDAPQSRQHLGRVHLLAIKAHAVTIDVMVDKAQLQAINYSLAQH